METVDPKRERTREAIGKFSERDAETWVERWEKVGKALVPAFLEWLHTPPPPPGEPDAMERAVMDSSTGFDPLWLVKTPYGICRDLFESDAVISFILRDILSIGFPPDTVTTPIAVFIRAAGLPPSSIRGSVHNMAHAAVKIILANGGEVFTQHEVDRVIIENGKASGIRLTDGTEVQATKLVVSTLDPYTLCFRLIGEEYIDWQILQRVRNLERRRFT